MACRPAESGNISGDTVTRYTRANEIPKVSVGDDADVVHVSEHLAQVEASVMVSETTVVPVCV